MPTDDKGREITGIESAIPATQLSQYGNKTRGGSNDLYNILADEAPGTPAEPAESTIPAQQVAAPAANSDVPAVDPIPDPVPAAEVDIAATPDAIPAAEDTSPTLAEGEEAVEVDNKEYEYLTSLEKDDIIAKMVAHRKGKATLQSRIDRIQDVVGSDLVKALEEGEDLQAVSSIMGDLQDPIFQAHIANFYETHERTSEGTYARTKGFAPTTDVFKKYTELLTKKAEADDLRQYMGEDTEFDANDALLNSQSSSGKALAARAAKLQEIDAEIVKLTSASGVSAPQPQVPVKAVDAKKTWDSFEKRHPEFKDKNKMAEFQTFVRETLSSHNPLEALYTAFQARANGTNLRKTLIAREMGAISTNLKSTPAPNGITSQKVTNKAVVPDNMSPEEYEKHKKDAAYFGDM